MSDWDFTVDSVIVGSGGGGLCAGLVGRTRGLDVLVVEKADVLGGSTAMSGGGLWVPDNPVMHDHGGRDSEAEALRYFDAVVGDAGPASSPERRKAYVEQAPRMVAFLQEQGIPFRWAEGYSDYYSDAPGGKAQGRTIEALPFDLNQLGPWVKRLRPGMTAGLGLVGFGTELSEMTYWNRSLKALTTSARVMLRTWLSKLRGQNLASAGGALMGRLLYAALAAGTQIWTDSPVAGLIVEGGRVAGVTVRRNGREVRVAARHGVLLAAGGFSRNDAMRARFGGEMARSNRFSRSNPGDTGEVLEMAMELGAATELLDEAIWLPMLTMPDSSHPPYPARQVGSFSRARWRPGSILVDSSGKRYANEAESHMELGQAMFARDKHVKAIPSWVIFDDAFRQRCLFGVLPGRMPERWITDGFVMRADTLDALAAQCGIDSGGLAETVQRFNEFARTGIDEDFHRGESAYDRFMGDPSWGPNNCLAPIAKGPFYAVAQYPCDLGTIGGVLTDASARVLDTSGTPIPGLYGTGNVTACVIGRRYLGAGATIGPTCTFGYVAMNHIADNAAR